MSPVFRPLLRALSILCLLLVAPFAGANAQKAPPPKPEVPALWELELGKSRAWLFGTVHALPRGVDWFKPHVVKALDESNRLVLETEVPESQAAIAPVIMKLTRLQAARPVVERVPPDWRPTLNQALNRLSPGPLDWTKTWFVAIILSNLQAQQDGVDPRIVDGTSWITGAGLNWVVFLLIVNLLLLFVGCFMEALAAMLILIPPLFPVAQMLGIDPVHFGMIVTLNISLGMITPPFGLDIFVTASTLKLPVLSVMRGVMPFIVVNLIVLLIVTYVPAISLWLRASR